MTSIALVTANFGDIDDIKPLPPVPSDVRALYYTQRSVIEAASEESKIGWEILTPNYPRHDFSPRLRARYFKHQIHRLDEVQNARWLMWADAIITFKNLAFLPIWAAELSQLPENQRILTIKHPHRGSVFDEYTFINYQVNKNNWYYTPRYGAEKMPEQMEWFKQQGWDTNCPVMLGTIWMVENSPLMNKAFNDWWDQNLRFGMMDQLSFYPVLKNNGIEPQILDITNALRDNVTWTEHKTP